MTGAVDTSNAPHYTWGGICDGWRLLDQPDLTVIEEQMPPSAAETRHFHNRATQLFYVLDGELTFQMHDKIETITKGRAFIMSAKEIHQVRNESTRNTRFLVVSAPATTHDREPA